MARSKDLLTQKKDQMFLKLKLLLESENLPHSAQQVLLLSDILSHIIENERRFRNGRLRKSLATKPGLMLLVDA